MTRSRRTGGLDLYEIEVSEQLDPEWEDMMMELEIRPSVNSTILLGRFDQASLIAVLRNLAGLGLSIERMTRRPDDGKETRIGTSQEPRRG